MSEEDQAQVPEEQNAGFRIATKDGYVILDIGVDNILLSMTPADALVLSKALAQNALIIEQARAMAERFNKRHRHKN